MLWPPRPGLVFPMVLLARAPGTTPPSPFHTLVTCIAEGPQKCLPEVWQAYGWVGLLIVLLVTLAVLLLSYTFLRPLGEILTEWGKKWWRSLLSLFGKRPSPQQIQQYEEEYLERARNELNPEEAATKLDAYLRALGERETPLKPSEEPLYVPLEGELAPEELSPTLGLHLRGAEAKPRSLWERLLRRLRPLPFNPEQIYREVRTFENMEEALAAIDPTTGHLYSVLALLGEPGAGKSTLMRRFARQQVERRRADPNERLPLFVSLGNHRKGKPLAFLREEWKNMVGYDGLDEALAQGKVWLFADGLNEMPRANYDLRLAQWRAFLNSEDFSGRATGYWSLAAWPITAKASAPHVWSSTNWMTSAFALSCASAFPTVPKRSGGNWRPTVNTAAAICTNSPRPPSGW